MTPRGFTTGKFKFEMKKKYLLMLLSLLIMGCGEDKNVYVDPDQFEAPAVTSTSIGEGETVRADTKQLVVTYDSDVIFNPLAKVSISQGEITSTEIIGERRLVLGLSLNAGKTYTVTVPGNAILGKDSKKYASTFELTFTTEGAPESASLVDKNLTNGKATAPAKKLYAALVENYGKKQISGAMGEVAWNTDFCEMIKEATGKFPAIVGFDYIHLNSSPSNWIDYGDITPVKKIWDAGSVPAMSWHWNVPTSENGSNVSFNSQNNNFKASNVLVEGTWENKVATADVMKLAGYLKLLQDADIPVLWRPFHEAAGDYTWGHWFWWGNSGVEVTKQLWVWLHEKLTNEYGLNNLIWVWTVQTSDAGKLASVSKLEAAYPGDEVVDIIGADLYVDAMSNQSVQFNLLNNLVKGKKIVALSECGNLLDVDAAFAEGALWSFFMGWYDMDSNGQLGFNQWNTNSEWKTVLNNPLVINQGDLNLK